jgi:hypothetical protein
MLCPSKPRTEEEEVFCCLSSSATDAEGEDTEGTLAWKRKALRPFIPVYSWMASKLYAF